MQFTFLEKYQPQLLAVLRIMTGLLFLEHGAVKLLHFPISMELPPGGIGILLTVAGAMELIGGALITVGVLTRLTAFLLSGEMAVGYFLGHAMQKGFWPVVNGGEAAILFCFIFLYIAAAGPGAWAVEKR
ncbi:MAG TPA: DoxX family protein [Rhizomicrobium sp.]|jgi:putative oxidoreductase|nr:DoxX family protein [Rhizomicrobium sp.]